jgi:hypothetical protein|tara:strand:- start:2794 stop:3717 length:924 start_codon:yes stop_codon:yes gene_type:complete
MKIVCTTVVRAAKPGDIHGGFYVIDTDTEEILHYMEYDEDFTNENERGGERGLRGIAVLDDRIIVSNSTGFLELDRQTFEIKRSHKDESVLRSIHEICVFRDQIWATSTSYDAIACLDLDFNLKGFWEVLGESMQDHKVLTGLREIEPGGAPVDDNYHINSICSHSGRLVFSGLISCLYDFETMNAVGAMPMMPNRSKSFIHNFYKYDDMVLANLTSWSCLGISKDKDGNIFQFIKLPRMKKAVYHLDDIATNNWNRGLARSGDTVLVGSSPARILVYNIKTNEFEKEIQLSDDIRHCVHGLEILED